MKSNSLDIFILYFLNYFFMILEMFIFISFVFSPFVFYQHIFCFQFCSALKIVFMLHNYSSQYHYLLCFHLCNLRIDLFFFLF